MAPGLRPFFIVLLLGQGAFLWWMSGQYRPSSSPAGEPTDSEVSRELPFQSFTEQRPANNLWKSRTFKFPSTAGYEAVASVNLDRPGHVIRDDIYGACDVTPEQIRSYSLSLLRWGGNRSSRFNWQTNADNAGKDWFAKNGGRPIKDPSQSGWVRFDRLSGDNGSNSYITVPMLGYVAKDHESYAYSVKKYGPQQSTEMGQPDVGNGVTRGGSAVTHNDWRDTSVEATPEFIADGVRLVARQAGERAKPRYWALDNEPMLWHETHRDVRHNPMGYDELWNRTVQYAEAIKKADSSAKIAGFCSWGWQDLYISAVDKVGGYGHSDQAAHGGMPLAEWFIKKCGEYKRQHGKSLVDVFDFHWYPQKDLAGNDPYQGTGNELGLNQFRMRTSRDLWDPSYRPESWIDQASGGKPTMALRQIREWIDRNNPGMEVSLGEYNFGGGDNITGAIAQADLFGILAREKADMAFIWAHPEGSQELAWKLFRNYDGHGAKFGERFVPTENNRGDLAVYAAKRSSDGATTIAVVNKSLGGQCTLKLNVPNLHGKMRVWRFDQETGEQVVEVLRDACDVDGTIIVTVPAASGTMLVVK